MNWKAPEQINLDNGETRTLVEGIGVVHGKIVQVWTAPAAVAVDTPEQLEARADALVEYGNSLPDGVTTEAFAEAENLRRKAKNLRSELNDE